MSWILPYCIIIAVTIFFFTFCNKSDKKCAYRGNGRKIYIVLGQENSSKHLLLRRDWKISRLKSGTHTQVFTQPKALLNGNFISVSHGWLVDCTYRAVSNIKGHTTLGTDPDLNYIRSNAFLYHFSFWHSSLTRIFFFLPFFSLSFLQI